MMSDRKERADMKKINQKQFNNNDYLTRLNMSDAPRDVRMQWLCKIIDNEMAKNVDEIDMELVNECQEELAELMAEERTERFAGQDASTSAESEYAGNLSSRGRTHAKGHTACYAKKRIRLASLIAAVVILASFASLSVVASSKGYASAFEYVSAMAKNLFNMNDGEMVEDGNITIIKNGEYTNYTSIEQMVREEKLDIMYPTNLPDDIRITEIVITNLTTGNISVNFKFNNSDINLFVYNNNTVNQEAIKTFTHTIQNKIGDTFYVQDACYQAVCHKSNKEYIILTQSYINLTIIINSISE